MTAVETDTEMSVREKRRRGGDFAGRAGREDEARQGH